MGQAGACAIATFLEYSCNMLEGAQLIVLTHVYVSRMCIVTFTCYLFVLSLTSLLNFLGWYPWGFLQRLQKKWSVADVWHLFPCVSSGLLRPSSENNSQGHVDLSQMSGPGRGAGVRQRAGPRRSKTTWSGLPFPSGLGEWQSLPFRGVLRPREPCSQHSSHPPASLPS